MRSVQDWSHDKEYHYRFLDDSFFAIVDSKLRKKLADHPNHLVLLSDIARLQWIDRWLGEGYEQVLWLDADFLIVDAEHFDPIAELHRQGEGYLLGRECWFDEDKHGTARVWRNVHNAMMVYSGRGKVFLDFYLNSASQLLHKQRGNHIPAQFVGPKLLTALHNIIQCPLYDQAGALSPYLLDAVNALSTCPQNALHLQRVESFKKLSGQKLYGVNLSASVLPGAIDFAQLQQQCKTYLAN